MLLLKGDEAATFLYYIKFINVIVIYIHINITPQESSSSYKKKDISFIFLGFVSDENEKQERI